MQLCPAYSFLLSSPRYIESSPLICSSDNHLISPAKLILINRQTCISFEYDIPTFSSLPAFFLCDFSRHLHKSTKDESDYDLLFVFPKFAKEVCIRYSINPPRYHGIKSYTTHNGNCRSDLSWILMGRVKNRTIECKRRERSEKVVAHKDSLIDTIAQTTADLLSRYLHDHVIPRAHQHQEAHDSKRMHQMIKSVHRPHIQRATIESSSSDEQLPAVQLQDNQNVKIYKKHRSQSDRAQKKSDDIQKNPFLFLYDFNQTISFVEPSEKEKGKQKGQKKQQKPGNLLRYCNNINDECFDNHYPHSSCKLSKANLNRSVRNLIKHYQTFHDQELTYDEAKLKFLELYPQLK